MSDSQLAERPQSVKDFLALPSYRDRFHEVMGKRANQFMASIVASAQMPALKDAEPRSVIAAAMVAATLDLPVNPTLGMAHIVAYGDKTGVKIAQFQCGYKGFIQLALRSGQYKRLNAGPVNAEVFVGYDLVGEPKLDWSEFDPVKETGGYFCAFELLNGFTKVVYWPRKQVDAHAKRFSKAYQKGYQSSPWFSDFDSMATKTVIKAALTKWGILSVEMQKAAAHDQGVQEDVDSDVKYVDGTATDVPGEAHPAEENGEAQAAPARATPPPRKSKGANAAAEPKPVERAIDVETVPPKTETPAPPSEKPADQPAPKAVEKTPEKPAERAAVKTAGPRDSLKEAEELTVRCTVKKVFALNITVEGATTPSVNAMVDGEYVGSVYHFGAAKQTPDGVVPDRPEWKVGNELILTIFGRINKKTGTVIARVDKVQLVEGQADTPVDMG